MLKRNILSILSLLFVFLIVSCQQNTNDNTSQYIPKEKTVSVRPVISPSAGDYPEGFKTISITVEDSDLDIFYTTDGSVPSNSSSRYTGPFSIIGSKTVKAVAYSGDNSGPVSTAVYNLNAGKAKNQLGVVTGVIGLADNFSKELKESLASSTVYIYSDELPGSIFKSSVGESFYIDGLDTSKSYSFYFSNKAPGSIISSRSAEVEKDSNGDPIVSVKVSDVTPSEGFGLNLSTVELKPTGTISGYAKKIGDNGEEESDHAGITVFIPGTSFAAYTASNGSFTMSGVPQGLHTVRAMYAGYTYAERENILLSTDSDETPKANIEEVLSICYANGTVKGSVLLSDDSEDYSGVTVVLTDATNSHSYNASTTKTGNWIVNNVAPGTYSIEFYKAGYVSQILNDVIVTGAKITMLSQIVLVENGGSITGSVSVSATSNLAGISVVAKNESKNRSYYALTDSEGNFKFNTLAVGNYTITATYPGRVNAL